MRLKPLIKKKLDTTIKLYAMVFIPMWVMFVVNNTILFNRWNRLGIHPREFELSNLVGIFGSWTMHANLSHIIGNSILMLQILFLFSLFERNPFRVIYLLIFGSGILTWLLGASFSVHIGASGLAFAMLGFMLGSAIFARRWGYLVACVFMGASFWVAMFGGLIPQTGISFAGHFGGLLAGLFIGADSENRHTKRLR